MINDIRIKQVDEALKRGDWNIAKSLLTAIRKTVTAENKEGEVETYLLQRLALVTYKSKYPNEMEALEEAISFLRLLDPHVSDDPETIGMWGAVHKRLWEITGKFGLLSEAVDAYKRGFEQQNDYYNGINYAFLLNLRANKVTDIEEAIADFMQASKVRMKVLTICKKWLEVNPDPYRFDDHALYENKEEYIKSRYWVLASMAEAYTGLEQHEKAKQVLEQAYAIAPQQWMQETTENQIEKLKQLINNSPLIH